LDPAGRVLTETTTGPTTAPGAPTAVTATAGNASAAVSWSAPASNGGSAITGYTVTASPGGATASTTGATSATVTGLTNGTAYTFTVTATNAVGTGVASVASNAVTPSATPSYAVVQQGTALLGTNASSVTVTLGSAAHAGDLLVATGVINPSTVTATPPAGFTSAGSTPGPVGHSGAAAWFKVAAGGETTFAFGQPASSGNYSQFTVTEISGLGSSVAIDGATAWQFDGNPVSGYTQTYGSAPAAAGELAFAFFHASNATTQTTPTGWSLVNGPTTANYQSGAYLQSAGSSSPTITTSNLTPTGAYTGGMIVFRSTSAPTAPGAPTGVTATAGNAQASVSWTAPASNGGSAITGYTVTASPGGATATTTGATSATVTGLTNGTAYTFTVKATNSVGIGVASAASNSVTPAAGASYAVVQQGTAFLGANASSVTVTLGSAARAGDLLIATGVINPSTVTATAPAGFTSAGSTPGPTGHSGAAAWFKVAAGGETTFAFGQPAASGNFSQFTVTEISGLGSSVAIDGATGWQFDGNAVSGYTQTYGSTPQAAGELAFAFFHASNATTQTTPTGWSLVNGPTTANYSTGAYLQSAVTSPPTITTSNLTPTGAYTGGMIVFRTTTGATAPGAPTGVTATAGNASATVSWTAPASNGGSAITGYTVTSSPGNFPATTAGATSAAVIGLTNGTTYTFTVTANNSVGTGPASAASNIVTPTSGTFVSNSAEGGTAGTSVTVANSGGASGNAFGVVTKGTGATLVYSNAAASTGSLGYALTGTSGTATYMGWNGYSATSTAVRFYYNPGPTLPNALLRLADIRNSTATAARVELSAANQIFIQNAAGTTVTTFSHPLQANTWYRIEITISVSASTATIKAAYYPGSSTTPVDPAFSTTTGNTGTANITQVSIGSTASATWVGTGNFDNLAVESLSTAFIGP